MSRGEHPLDEMRRTGKRPPELVIGKPKKPKPIIFQAANVLAILGGWKTQTRRPVSLREFGPSTTDGYDWTFRDRRALWQDLTNTRMLELSPYGGPGDRLWVREAVEMSSQMGDSVYVADREPCDIGEGGWRWKRNRISPLHMPFAARRLELDVISVRIERLQNISIEDAIAEGARRFTGLADASPAGPRYDPKWSMENPTSHRECLGSPQMAFANYYCKIHGGERWNLKPGPSPWDVNPFVWVVEFKARRV